MMRRVRRFFSLPENERRLLLRALVRLSITCAKLHLLPQSKWRALLASNPPGKTAVSGRYSEEQIAWAVRGAARYVPLANCLPQAIVARQMLAEQGYQPVLRIGVQPPGLRSADELSLRAHAWVESGGRIVLGEDDSGYHALIGDDVAARKA